jgi:hypothetical protein
VILLFGTKRRAERIKYTVLKRHALTYDLDQKKDYLTPGLTPPEVAYGMILCGYDLLLRIADNGVPSLERRTRRRARKWMHEMLLYFASQPAQLLSHMIPTLYAATGGRLSDTGQDEGSEIFEPAHHLALERAVEDFFPLPTKIMLDSMPKKLGMQVTGLNKGRRGRNMFRHLLDRAMAEFHVMETHEPREEVVKGDEPASDYSAALLRGENPDENPELVEAQRLYARDYFINRASIFATRAALPREDFQRLDQHYVQVLDPNDPGMEKYRKRLLAAWIEGSRRYREYAAITHRTGELANLYSGQLGVRETRLGSDEADAIDEAASERPVSWG